MDKITQDTFAERQAPQVRLELEKQIDDEYATARQLLKDKQYKQSLKKFKWVFAQSGGSRRFLSRVDITELTRNYKPAAALVKRWRNDKEKLVVEGKADSRVIWDWATLNDSLGDKHRTLEIFFTLRDGGATDKQLKAILHKIWKRLAATKKYEALKSYLPSLGFNLLLHATEYDAAILFPEHRKVSKKLAVAAKKRHLDYARTEGVLSYEVALGLGEKEIASAFAKKILGIETSDLVFARLIKGALRAKAYPEAKSLFNEAEELFSRRRLRLTLKAFKALPEKFR